MEKLEWLHPSHPTLQTESILFSSVCIVMKISEDYPGARDGGKFPRSLIMGPCRGVMRWLNGTHLQPPPPPSPHAHVADVSLWFICPRVTIRRVYILGNRMKKLWIKKGFRTEYLSIIYWTLQNFCGKRLFFFRIFSKIFTPGHNCHSPHGRRVCSAIIIHFHCHQRPFAY